MPRTCNGARRSPEAASHNGDMKLSRSSHFVSFLLLLAWSKLVVPISVTIREGTQHQDAVKKQDKMVMYMCRAASTVIRILLQPKVAVY